MADEKDYCPPFDKGSGDVVLRSSNLTEFIAHKSILSEASPFFTTTFALPQRQKDINHDIGTSAHEERDGRPIIPFTEKDRTIAALLRLIYPYDDPELDSLELTESVLAAALKYDCTEAVKLVKAKLMFFAPAEPVRVYAFTITHDMVDEARAAARHALAHPVPGALVPELEYLSAAAYHRLIEYHVAAQEAVADMASRLEWIPLGAPEEDLEASSSSRIRWLFDQTPYWLSCGSCEASAEHIHVGSQGEEQYLPRAWWTDYLEKAQQKLNESPANTEALSADVLRLALRKASKCGAGCALHVNARQMQAFVKYFAWEVERRTSEIVLEL